MSKSLSPADAARLSNIRQRYEGTQGNEGVLLRALDTAQAELARLRAPTGNAMDREALGREVRRIWIEWAKEQPNPKASWLLSWEDIGEPDREVDRRIGERIAAAAEARARQAEREAIRSQLGYRLNNHLCDMQEGYDDSVVGFNDAWKVVDSVFDNPTPKESARQAGVRAGIEMAAQICRNEAQRAVDSAQVAMANGAEEARRAQPSSVRVIVSEVRDKQNYLHGKRHCAVEIEALVRALLPAAPKEGE